MVKAKIIITICLVTIANSIALAQLPDHFDWRNVNGKNYMSPVKDQGDCGSCGPFAAVGAVEAQYNIYFDWPEYDIDLSEEHLVSNGCFPYNCAGGFRSQYWALDFIKNSGITDEACFPYVDLDCEYACCWKPEPEGCPCLYGCSNATCDEPYRCSAWSDRLWKIDGVGYASSAVESIKNYIYNTGPLVVVMDVGGEFVDGIWRCYDPPPPLSYDHAVVIAGWDETDDYWIVKNSWDTTWPPHDPGGYFKVGFWECLIQNIAYGVTLSNPDTDKFYIKNSSGEKAAWFGNRGNLVLKGTFTSGGTCTAPSGSFIIANSTDPTVAYIDSEGNMCIEGALSELSGSCNPAGDAFIIKNASDANVAYIDFANGNLCLTGKLYQNPGQ